MPATKKKKHATGPVLVAKSVYFCRCRDQECEHLREIKTLSTFTGRNTLVCAHKDARRPEVTNARAAILLDKTIYVMGGLPLTPGWCPLLPKDDSNGSVRARDERLDRR